jgi:hypothetical protein
MQDLWDEGNTGARRDAFIASMYAFPATPAVALSDGRAMPVLGVSTWLQASVQDTVEHALRRGFRCAPCPGPSIMSSHIPPQRMHLMVNISCCRTSVA